MLGPYPYEIHLTVQTADIGRFKTVCQDLGLKPIVLSLQNHFGGCVMTDVMTSGKFSGNDSGALARAFAQRNELELRQLAVKRMKIETVPWHPMAAYVGQKPGAYFEAHLAVRIPAARTDVLLRKFARQFNAHRSQNAIKETSAEQIWFFTLRRDNCTAEQFQLLVVKARQWMLGHKYELEKIPEIEFALFDTDRGWDRSWIEGGDMGKGAGKGAGKGVVGDPVTRDQAGDQADPSP